LLGGPGLKPTARFSYAQESATEHGTRGPDHVRAFEDYERVGVLEYVVRAIEPDEVLWFVLRKGRFVDLATGPDGIYRSEVFPGLWLDPEALLRGDTRQLRKVLDQGCAT